VAYIGQVIQKLRVNRKLSRNTLSNGICTEKYLYLIEKGQRTPSSEVSHLLSARLGVDLFQYYEYLDCIEPIYVHDAINKLNAYRRTTNFSESIVLIRELALHPDFQKPPYSYELEVDKLGYRMFIKNEYVDAIEDIISLIDSIDNKYSGEEFTANLYVLLSTALQNSMRLEEAKKAQNQAMSILENKEGITKYHQVIYSSRLNRMTLAYLERDYQAVINDGLWLYDFSNRTNVNDRSDFTYYCIAMGYWGAGQKEEAMLWLENCVFAMLTNYRPYDISIISSFGPFTEMIRSSKICDNILNRLKRMYPEIIERL
jgi:transcriptional regulator with XRE-family HTH domain